MNQIPTCNNCDRDKCTKFNKIQPYLSCVNHQKIESKVKLKKLVSKISILKIPTTAATLSMFKPYNY